ncbi:septum site-determining protein MinC [Helicobacter sp. MIT 14-3879]|uniref:septum site-determining protein MinC n=1 Tax=Helicobacter sp. MIT 14-3879 TaxID=2040649 RepID=UPI000E1E8154|nr:septum site-determining protein MinC [Helicobacter sp. MIT 14-3879]RDU65581.1 hypothetical protein CQA44_00975 [Helicobacter sp. MIT 14-3879]
MPKIDQKNIQVFHILKDNNIDELKSFISKNYKILQAYLLVFDELDYSLREILDEYSLDYIVPKNMRLNNTYSNIVFNEGNKNNKKIDNKADNKTKEIKTKIYRELIRSGVDINSNDEDIVIFSRVNSASNIKSSKNICIYGRCDGNVECNGEYMILSNNTRGKILFNGFAITSNMLKYRLNLITKDNDMLNIIDILSL